MCLSLPLNLPCWPPELIGEHEGDSGVTDEMGILGRWVEFIYPSVARAYQTILWPNNLLDCNYTRKCSRLQLLVALTVSLFFFHRDSLAYRAAIHFCRLMTRIRRPEGKQPIAKDQQMPAATRYTGNFALAHSPQQQL